MMSNSAAAPQTDRRNRFRIGKCGKYQRSAESIERQRAKLVAYWADPENRARQSKLTRARMARPGVSEKISERTATALADPTVKKRQIDGLTARFSDPALREKISANTKAGMRRRRAERLGAAEKVLPQLPRGERDA
jgi:hypothetical protein